MRTLDFCKLSCGGSATAVPGKVRCTPTHSGSLGRRADVSMGFGGPELTKQVLYRQNNPCVRVPRRRSCAQKQEAGEPQEAGVWGAAAVGGRPLACAAQETKQLVMGGIGY